MCRVGHKILVDQSRLESDDVVVIGCCEQLDVARRAVLDGT